MQRVRAAIVEAAATVLSRDEHASMQAVAEAAGVGRATLYRHFPSRETLLCALADAAVAGAGESLQRANLDAVAADEAIARATRALLSNAEHYAVVSRSGLEVDPEVAPARLHRAADGALRAGAARRGAARRPPGVAALRLLARDGGPHRPVRGVASASRTRAPPSSACSSTARARARSARPSSARTSTLAAAACDDARAPSRHASGGPADAARHDRPRPHGREHDPPRDDRRATRASSGTARRRRCSSSPARAPWGPATLAGARRASSSGRATCG